VPLHGADLTVVRVRLPAAQLGRYLRPTPGRPVAGRMLAGPLRRDALVPTELLVTSATADLVGLGVQADADDMAQDLRPGDRVQVLAAYTEGAHRGRAVLLLQDAEVIRVLEEPGGLTGPGQQHGVQLRIPGSQATDVAAAVATARIFIVKGPACPTPPFPATGPTRAWTAQPPTRPVRGGDRTDPHGGACPSPSRTPEPTPRDGRREAPAGHRGRRRRLVRVHLHMSFGVRLDV
jgi:hypothetical protein